MTPISFHFYEGLAFAAMMLSPLESARLIPLRAGLVDLVSAIQGVPDRFVQSSLGMPVLEGLWRLHRRAEKIIPLSLSSDACPFTRTIKRGFAERGLTEKSIVQEYFRSLAMLIALGAPFFASGRTVVWHDAATYLSEALQLANEAGRTPSRHDRAERLSIAAGWIGLLGFQTFAPQASAGESIHDADTGPISLKDAGPAFVAGAADLTIKQASGTVETAAPDDPTKGHPIEEASPRVAQSGFTERIEENAPAVPMAVLTGNGTERLVEKTERLEIEVAAPSSHQELVLDEPVWTHVLEENRKRQRDFLVQFQGPRGRSLIGETLLQSAIGFLERFGVSSDLNAPEVSLILSYLGLSRMGLWRPFDLDREIDLMRRHPASLPPVLESEIKELRELLAIEPSESNRQVLRHVLKEAGENVFWLMHPTNRILHLLCRKRADNKDPEALRRYPLDLLSTWGRFCRLSK